MICEDLLKKILKILLNLLIKENLKVFFLDNAAFSRVLLMYIKIKFFEKVVKRRMKKIKGISRYLLGIIGGTILVSCLCVFAAGSIINSEAVKYDNRDSGGSSENVKGSIDELYKMSGVDTKKYTEAILHGADPALGDGMIPVTIDKDGVVKYANVNTPWYCYQEKKWANAVILSGGTYKVGDIIKESDIQSYFVWVPRFRYKVWNASSVDGYVSTYANTANDANSVRHLTGNARLIDVVFEDKNATVSSGEYLTHPAFTAFGVSGLWFAKFEASGTTSAITVKPNMTSLRSTTVGAFWNAFYNYKRGLDSHMIKNTEWGAAAYLSHSAYGIGNEININNNSAYKTGYSAAANTDQSSYTGTSGTKEVTDDDGPAVTQPYNSATGYLASTTGNITGIYDMSGGAWEYVAGYVDGYGVTSSGSVVSGLIATDLAKTQYFDKYDKASGWTTFSKRILGDATGEMGPFYYYMDKDGNNRIHNGWYADSSGFVEPTYPWFSRGGVLNYGVLAGLFYFGRHTGGASGDLGSRLVLAVK